MHQEEGNTKQGIGHQEEKKRNMEKAPGREEEK
jgi:hypothetical protein